ncbi:MAG: hypothetical protein GWN00_18375, partial [Aliifodinibius sp.]|nr:hypothetical protein [Fodinibius sp.]NIY26699.1 hypothetical protein [Fodinibius sp.]
MRILLIRHGSREDSKNTDGKNTPLTPEGQKETRRLGELLVRLSLKPEAYLTSQYRHSQEMGGLLAGQFDGGTPAPVISLSALTPHSSTHSFN